MTVRVVQLGTRRARGERVRLGTVRRPPRGVFKKDWAAKNHFDVWLPMLAPSAKLLSSTYRSKSSLREKTFAKRYLAEMNRPDASRLLDALAALSHVANFSVGCYCEDEAQCHRRFLRKLLTERGAEVR